MSDTTDSHRLLWTGFLRSCEQFPTRGAIDVAGRKVTYQQLGYFAKRLAATLQAGTVSGAVPLTAVFAYRSETAYAAVLGVLMAGHGYVPLNRTFPVERTRLMLERSMCRSMIVDAGSEDSLYNCQSRLSTVLPQNSLTRIFIAASTEVGKGNAPKRPIGMCFERASD
jgi:acyl-CoA synthetase (AMP-forming)/AMP-acid ligase II